MSEPTRESDFCEHIFVQLRDEDVKLLKSVYSELAAKVKVLTPKHISSVVMISAPLQKLNELILLGMYNEHSILKINPPHVAGLSKSRMPGVIFCTRYDDSLRLYQFQNAYFLDVHTLDKFELGVVGLMLLWISGLRQSECSDQGATMAKTIEVPADQAKLLLRISRVLANPDVQNEAIQRKVRSLVSETQRFMIRSGQV